MRDNYLNRKTQPLSIDPSAQPNNNRENNPFRPSIIKPSSPSNSSGKHVMFKSNIDSVNSDYASGGGQLQHILLRNQSKGLSIDDVQSGSGFNNGWGNAVFNRMLCQRMARQIVSLKQTTSLLKALVQERQQQFDKFRQSTAKELISRIQKHYIDLSSKRSGLNSSQLALEDQIRSQKRQNLELLQEIQDLKSQKEQFSRFKGDDVSSRSGGICSNCRLLEIKLSSVREQAVNSGRQLHQAHNQIQKLQEAIFDLQQKVVGVELEVEKKLKKAILQMPELKAQAPQIQAQPPNSQLIDNLRQSLNNAQRRCQHYESLCKTQQFLSQREEELDIRQKQYQLKNEALLQSIARAEQTNNRNYEKEHQLLLAQEQFYQKLQSLRAKQAQLSQWEKSLVNKNVSQQISASLGMRNSNMKGDEISMKNLAVDNHNEAQEQYYSEYRGNHNTNQLIRSGDNFNIPKLQIKQQGIESRVSYDRPNSQYQHQSRYSNKMQYHNPRRNTYDISSKVNYPYRTNIVSSPSNKVLGIRNIGDKYSRSKDIMGRHSGVRERSNSPTRSFKSSHLNSHSKGVPSYGGSYNKAENKLEKLKEDLKRQLQSIK